MHEAMSQPHRLSTTFGVLSLLGSFIAGSAFAQDATRQPAVMEVTSDTPEYCLHLLDRVSELVRVARAPVPLEVTELTTEGHRMCDHGQTRSGIMRLRSALLMMEKGSPTLTR